MATIADLLPLPTWLLVLILFFGSLYTYGTWNHSFFKKLGIPGPRPLPLVGSISILVKHGFRYDTQLVSMFGKVFGYFEGVTPVAVFCDPQHIKQITVKDFDHFVNRRTGLPFGEELSKSVSLVNDEEWKGIRNVITPTFSAGKMKKMAAVVSECADEMVESLSKYADSGEECEVHSIAGCYTMDVIARTQFGIKVNSQKETDNPFVKYARKGFANTSFSSPALILLFFFPFLSPVFEKFKFSLFSRDVIDFFRDKVYEILDLRKSMKEKPVDFLQLMLDATSEDKPLNEKEAKLSMMADDTDEAQNYTKKWQVGKKSLSKLEILSNSLVFFLAGYETTANTIAWMMYLVALHPDVQEKLHDEVKRVLEENKHELTYETVAKMQYMDQVFCETLRLYPAAQRTDRICNASCEIGGYTIPKGTVINIGIWAVHRDPEYWPEPEKFDPERFAPENRDKIVPYSYLPFGQGPRNCIGMRLANLEAKMALARVVDQFIIERSPKTEVPMKFRNLGFTSSLNGVWVRVQKRH